MRHRGRGSVIAAVITTGARPQALLAAAMLARTLQDAAGDISPLDRYSEETLEHHAQRKAELVADAQRWLRNDAYVWCGLMDSPDVWEDMLLERTA